MADSTKTKPAKKPSAAALQRAEKLREQYARNITWPIARGWTLTGAGTRILAALFTAGLGMQYLHLHTLLGSSPTAAAWTSAVHTKNYWSERRFPKDSRHGRDDCTGASHPPYQRYTCCCGAPRRASSAGARPYQASTRYSQCSAHARPQPHSAARPWTSSGSATTTAGRAPRRPRTDNWPKVLRSCAGPRGL